MEKDTHPTTSNGKICYIEIPALDINISESFYKKVYSWNTRKRGDGQIAFDDTVGQVSGTWVLGRKPETQAGTLVYIMVDDIHLTVKAILDHGGKIVQQVG